MRRLKKMSFTSDFDFFFLSFFDLVYYYYYYHHFFPLFHVRKDG